MMCVIIRFRHPIDMLTRLKCDFRLRGSLNVDVAQSFYLCASSKIEIDEIFVTKTT